MITPVPGFWLRGLKYVKSTASALLVVLLSFCAACQRQGSHETQNGDRNNRIRIGVFMSLTGDTASYGISSVNAIRLATEEINTSGGIGGKQLELVVEDDHSNTQEVTGLVNKLITQDKVLAIVGESVSTRALAAAPVAQANKVVMISPASVKPEVTLQGDYIFRACFTSPKEGAAVAEFALNKLKARRAAIILDQKNDYAVVLASFFREHFKRLGGETVSEESYAATDKDISKQTAAIKATHPDVIFAPGFYTTAGLVARAVKQQHLEAALIGSDGWDSPQLLEAGGESLRGVYVPNHFWVNNENALVQRFVRDYKLKYGLPPDALAATAYDAARMLFDAIRRARSVESAAIRDALAKTADFSGVTGTITLDAERNALVPVYILRIEENGQFSLQERISP
jgi:branched-chain amino acid transport system substrate-binding protein